MTFKGVTAKLWILMVTLVLLVIVAFGLAVNFLFADFYTNQKLTSLEQSAKEIASSLSGVKTMDELQAQLANFHYTENTTVVVLNNLDQVEIIVPGIRGMGRGMGMGMSMSPGFTLDDVNFGKVMGGSTVATTLSLTNGAAYAVAATPLKLGEVTWALVVSSPLAPVTESINSFRHMLYYVAGVAVILATLFALWLSRTLATPLVEMNRVARRMSEGDFSDRLQITSQDEIGDLGQSLNKLAEDLDRHIKLLSREKERLGGILASIGDAVITLNDREELVQANGPAEDLWLDDENRKNVIMDELRHALQAVTRTGNTVTRDVELDTQVLSIHMEPLKEAEGQNGGVAVVRDVTAGRRQEKQRRELMATISHELRTPIHLIQGQLEALVDGLVPPVEQINYLEMSLEEVQRLGRLVGDLQEINRLERGFPVVQNRLDLAQLAMEVAEKYKGKAENNQVALQVNAEQAIISGDKDRLTQVFVNLLENSLRYTPAGGRVEVVVHPSKDVAEMVIKDTGSGITTENLPLIWESFFRGDQSGKEHMGLGLTIVKRIIEAHGGTVGAASEPGKGTSFTIRIPLMKE